MPKFNLITPDDNKISLEAKGVLSTMLNLPESDYHTAEELCQFFESDSLQTIRKALSELTDAGYLLCMNNKTSCPVHIGSAFLAALSTCSNRIY